MTKIEKIKRYIERTAIPHAIRERYETRWSELLVIIRESPSVVETACLAFEYGRAKGYRAGKKAAELEQAEAHSEKRQRVASVRPAASAAEGRAAL